MHTCELLINIYVRGASIQIYHIIAQYPAHLLLQEKMLRYQDLKTVQWNYQEEELLHLPKAILSLKQTHTTPQHTAASEAEVVYRQH